MLDAPGTPWVFKVRGSDRIGGFGFFSYWTTMPLGIAWETFGRANGVSSYSEMRGKVEALRRAGNESDLVGCVVLFDTTILTPDARIAAPSDWHPNIVRGAGYDISAAKGARMERDSWLRSTRRL